MKKIVSMGMAAVLVAMNLAACSSGGSGTAATAPAGGETTAAAAGTGADLSSVNLIWATDAVGASTYNIGVEMSKVLETAGIGMVDISPTSPGGMGAPYLFAGDTGVDIAFVNGAPAKWAREEGTLGREAIDGVYKAIAGGLSGVCTVNLLTNDFIKKHGVTSLDEVFEKKLPLRIGCSAIGSMDAECAFLVLEYYGIDRATLESWGGSITHGSGDEISDLIADGQVDFYIDHTSQNSSTMAEIALTQDVTFNVWSDDMVDWFVREKGFQRVTIPADSFKGQTADIVYPGSPDCIFVRADMEEEVAYTIAKALSENRDALVEKYESLVVWDPSKAWEEERIGGNELHPGARRYYEEAGYIK